MINTHAWGMINTHAWGMIDIHAWGIFGDTHAWVLP